MILGSALFGWGAAGGKSVPSANIPPDSGRPPSHEIEGTGSAQVGRALARKERGGALLTDGGKCRSGRASSRRAERLRADELRWPMDSHGGCASAGRAPAGLRLGERASASWTTVPASIVASWSSASMRASATALRAALWLSASAGEGSAVQPR